MFNSYEYRKLVTLVITSKWTVDKKKDISHLFIRPHIILHIYLSFFKEILIDIGK